MASRNWNGIMNKRLCRMVVAAVFIAVSTLQAENGLGAEDASQNDQGIADHFARPGQHATHVYQQASYGVHVGRIIESTSCSKFT
jgi:hypothetical protein